jgi:hypothetical protein
MERPPREALEIDVPADVLHRRRHRPAGEPVGLGFPVLLLDALNGWALEALALGVWAVSSSGGPHMARVTRPAELVLVVDQVVPADPLVALELDRFERARDPTHQRTLADADVRHFFEPNELRCMHTDFVLETRDLERYLDLAACEGEEREPTRALAPGASFPVTVGWYLLRR